mmetsp:Transcript_17464/g.40886  ORF Transcript_17464/g.40886 Transcript_17464/m.40886 type:complete len:104 (-) Transcript_17464:118-429(-)
MATELHAASRAGDSERVARLVGEKGVDINAMDGIGRTPFYLACREGKLECVKVLKEAGANVNQATKWNVSPYQASTITERHDVCRYLVDECGVEPPPEEKASS